jgi:hypothetical protein
MEAHDALSIDQKKAGPFSSPAFFPKHPWQPILPAVYHVIRIAVMLCEQIGDCPQIIKVDVVGTQCFPGIDFNTETPNPYSHVVMVTEVLLHYATETIVRLGGNSHGKLSPALEIQSAHVELEGPPKEIFYEEIQVMVCISPDNPDRNSLGDAFNRDGAWRSNDKGSVPAAKKVHPHTKDVIVRDIQPFLSRNWLNTRRPSSKKP